MPDPAKRFGLLDSLRYLAIAMVASYHYYYRFYKLYPYGDKYRDIFFFEYGYMGVELFFMISGFVIMMTLENSKNIRHFFLRRFIRLFPTMVICSIITYLAFVLFDADNHLPSLHSPMSSFIPSWTFSDPYLWELVLGRRMSYIDGAYWSLAVEVKFYIIAALIYFFDPKKFFRNWLCVVAFAVAVRILFQHHIIHTGFGRLIDIILFPKFIVLFTIGMFFYLLRSKEKMGVGLVAAVIFLICCQLFAIRLVSNTYIEKIYLLVFIGIFTLMHYRHTWLSPFSKPLVERAGQASYALYLLHENIGLLLIFYLSILFNSTSPLLPVVVFLMLTIAAIALYYFVELPLTRKLKRYLIKSTS